MAILLNLVKSLDIKVSVESFFCEVEQHYIIFVTNVIYYEASQYLCKYLGNETLVKKTSATALCS